MFPAFARLIFASCPKVFPQTGSRLFDSPRPCSQFSNRELLSRWRQRRRSSTAAVRARHRSLDQPRGALGWS